MNIENEKRSRIAQLIDNRIEELRGVKSQKEIARIVGYKSPNIITMIKQGDTKVSLDRVQLMAKALDVDVKMFYRLALEQFYSVETVAGMFEMLSGGLTPNELELLSVYRQIENGEKLVITPEIKIAIKKILT